MAEETKQQSGAAADKKAEEPTYHRDRLIEEAYGFFQRPSHVVRGALSAGRLASRVQFTRAEAERAIGDFLDHEVETDHVRKEG